jgi:hypothetical protein
MEYLIGWLVFPFASASVAKGKGRNVYLWAGIGLLLGPFSILIVAMLEPAQSGLDGAEHNAKDE